MKKKILVLFAQEWDLAELSRPEYRQEFEFFFEGFDLFRFPDNARLLTFNARRFDGTSPRLRPGRARRQWLKERYPDARLFLHPKRGAGLAREMKWLGSHRYATLNLGGESRHDLEQRYRAVCREFALETP